MAGEQGEFISVRRSADTHLEATMRPTMKIVAVGTAVIVVAGLVVSFIARVRGAAQRIQCSNNLKQIVLAVQNYHDTYGKFPPRTHPSNEIPIEKRLSLLFEIVPFIESDNIYSRAKKDESWDSFANRHLTEDHWVYLCPAGPRMRHGFQSGLTHFVGNAGLGPDAATYPVGDKRNGFFGYDRQVTLKDVTDGLGNTIMIMETSRENGPWAAGGPATLRGFDPEDMPYFGQERQLGGMHMWSSNFFSKRFPSFQCGLGDGSVRFLNPSIDPQLLEASFTIAGGVVPHYMFDGW
jgi:hypothetical protein